MQQKPSFNGIERLCGDEKLKKQFKKTLSSFHFVPILSKPIYSFAPAFQLCSPHLELPWLGFLSVQRLRDRPVIIHNHISTLQTIYRLS